MQSKITASKKIAYMAIPENYFEFTETLTESTPPKSWPLALTALWHDANENWEASHDIAQDMHDSMGSWIHAYLHRKEGDKFNAGYWYRQANRPFSNKSLPEELQELVEFVLEEG